MSLDDEIQDVMASAVAEIGRDVTVDGHAITGMVKFHGFGNPPDFVSRDQSTERAEWIAVVIMASDMPDGWRPSGGLTVTVNGVDWRTHQNFGVIGNRIAWRLAASRDQRGGK